MNQGSIQTAQNARRFIGAASACSSAETCTKNLSDIGRDARAPRNQNGRLSAASSIPRESSPNYKNVTHGEQLFKMLSPALAYKKCPKLKALLDKMLALAQEAGL